jgi:hypothetical protein
LKKRSKKLLRLQVGAAERLCSIIKSFLVLFFKKEHSFYHDLICTTFMLHGVSVSVSGNACLPSLVSVGAAQTLFCD